METLNETENGYNMFMALGEARNSQFIADQIEMYATKGTSVQVDKSENVTGADMEVIATTDNYTFYI